MHCVHCPCSAAEQRQLGYHRRLSPWHGDRSRTQVGLAHCNATYEAVECKAPTALTFAGAVSIDSDITLNEKTGRIEVVELQFSKEVYPAVAAALVAQLGEPTATDGDYRADEWRRAGRNSCSPVLVWHRGGDDVVAVCGGGWHTTAAPTWLPIVRLGAAKNGPRLWPRAEGADER